jgi:hypothetical protein
VTCQLYNLCTAGSFKEITSLKCLFVTDTTGQENLRVFLFLFSEHDTSLLHLRLRLADDGSKKPSLVFAARQWDSKNNHYSPRVL